MSEKANLIKELVKVPENYEVVEETAEPRNSKAVLIVRYQKNGGYTYNGPRIIEVVETDRSGDHLVSFKNFTHIPKGKLLSAERAKRLAEKVFRKINRSYARGLSFIRIEKQTRSFIDENGKKQQFPVQWVKFAHKNGSYNWVTLGAAGSIVEMEIDSRWDYTKGRRKTEMWDNDDWVLAREGKGPQLPSPQALA